MERELYSELLRNGIRPIMQPPIGKYFADFALSKEKVVIEYDGPQHEQQQEYDQVRDAFMQGQGWTVYRVSGRRFCQIRKAGEFWALIQKFDRAVSYIVCDARGKIDEWIDTVREEGGGL